MPVDDLGDPWEAIRALQDEVRRLKRTNPLESASVTSGRVRFIGGLLLIDSGGTLTVVGHFNGDGDFVWNGPWALKGLGEITGDVQITGDLALLDDGKFTSENVRVEGGKIYVGAGASLIVIDGATGEIIAGGTRLTPAGGGALSFGSGARVIAADGSPGVRVQSGSVWEAIVGANGISLKGDVGNAALTLLANLASLGADRVQISANALVLGVGTMDRSEAVHYLGRRFDGTTGWVSMASGGPTGSGLLRWPFDLSTVSYEFNTTDPAYTPPGHRGIDFAIAGGTPIPAAGSGTVLAVGFDSERGYFVILDHGDHDGRNLTTRYYHLIGPSPLAEGAPIAKGEIVGAVGSTGLSTGNHLHWETRYDGVAENPRAVMAVYGE